MILDPGIIQVDRLIIHNIPQPPHKNEPRLPLKVTDVESDLTQDDKNFFSEKIQNSLNKVSYQAAFDSSLNSPVPEFIYEILNNNSPENDKFVSLSQSIAGHLHQSQTAANTSGLLVIIKLKYGNKPALAILKLEKEEGMQYKEIDDKGLTTYEVQQIYDLMLTGGKVFKIG
jgi:nucleoid-associated protein YejK